MKRWASTQRGNEQEPYRYSRAILRHRLSKVSASDRQVLEIQLLDKQDLLRLRRLEYYGGC